MEGAPPPSPTTSSTSNPSSPASSTAGGSSDSSSSAAAAATEHAPPRRRLVKASSIVAKREVVASGAGTGPPGFGLDRSLPTSPAASIATGSGPAGSPLMVPSSTATVTNTFRERAGMRPIAKGDVQSDYPVLPSHGPAGASGPAKLGRPPFVLSPGIMGDRLLGRRPETPSQRKHAAEDARIQQAKRACLLRAQSATGNYKNFDSPFGNYMVPVIPNQLFNKTPTSAAVPTSPSNSSPGVGR